ncbi:MAG: GNAT family N-acetyltransferase [Actinomycetota bacterium]
MTDPWDRANVAAEAAGVEVHRLTTLEEADGALGVMTATWGEHQLVPRELLRAFQASGSLFQGAFKGGEMVGFALGFFGFDDAGVHLHSHMLAVMPDARSSGVGLALKLAQRAATLDADVGRIRWTFDPLVARNAYFNLAKLGAVADAFHRDFYGAMEDLLNSGDRTDRLLIIWDLEAKSSHAEAEGFEVLGRIWPEEAPRPTEVHAPEGAPALVSIPKDHAELRRSDPGLGAAWREAAAAAFEACFAAGLVASGFTRDARYVFT